MLIPSLALLFVAAFGLTGWMSISPAQANDSAIALDVPDGFRALASSLGYVNVLEGASLFVTHIDSAEFNFFVEKGVMEQFRKRAYKETMRQEYPGEGEGVMVQGRRVDGAMVTHACTLVWRDGQVAAVVEIEVPERAELPFAESPCEGIRGLRRRAMQ